MTNSLKNDATKLKLIELAKTKSALEASLELEIPLRTCYDFLAKQTWRDWWKEYDWKHSGWKIAAEKELHSEDIAAVLDGKFLPKEWLAGGTRGSENTSLRDIRNKDTSIVKKTAVKILVIADTQAKPNKDLSYMTNIGKYIFDKKPDIVVHIGDGYDFESLSSYDKGKKSFEGRRLKADIEAGNLSLELLIKEFKKDGYSPRMVYCLGNHEFRFNRLAEDMPELDGFVGTDTLPLLDMGWEVHDFLKPVEIEGIFFVHYLANPMTGKPYGGSALNQLKTVGRSFVVGHKQCLDVAIRPTIDGKHQIGIINGAAYDFDEPYKGYSGNNHFRGVTMLHEVKDGFGLPMFVSLDYLKDKYGK